ncbi:MAG: 3-phosphoshikimate 1-carboxyvinyltransferase [Lachnospiraceae bacterium]|nr:3-phosphoshikimate 1-carboxyvinyltransferase [Lachnospiraceae bacterium]
MQIHPIKGLKGRVSIPGDKSISHRAVMFGALAEGTTEITHFLEGADCLSTIACFREMGIEIEQTGDCVLVHGKGLHGLQAPSRTLDAGNSGTTTRLISGILCGSPFASTLTGDASVQKRPMNRIITPLRQMGAGIDSVKGNDCVPLKIQGHALHAIHYQSPVASAQVKSCLLLAGMFADGCTSVTEPVLSRNHTELMLRAFGADVRSEGTCASIAPDPRLFAQKIAVPGDISSAAYFLAAGLLVPNSEVYIENVGINPTRSGILEVALAMGGNIEKLNERTVSGEPVCDLLVRSSSLHGVTIDGDIIPTLIDEIPVLAVMAAYAEGQTSIRDAAELKVKETNRIDTVTANLRAMGAEITAEDDGMTIQGGRPLHGAKLDSYLDHRIAMSFAVAALCAEGTTNIRNGECVNISYPDFYRELSSLSST